jgi:hypothetical protein
VYAGKEPSLHYMGLWDLEYLGSPYAKERESVRRAVAERRWDLVFVGNQRFPYQILDHYGRPEVFLERGDPSLMPKTGYRARPERVLRPKVTGPR